MTNLWDKISKPYLKGLKADVNADYAYEKLVNSLSILSLCSSSGNVLDLGCGDGRFTRDLEARFDNVYAVDYSKTMLNLAKKLCKNTKFFNSNLEHSFPKLNIKFDAIICKLLLMYLQNIDNLAFNSYKHLVSKGYLIISVTHPLKWISNANYQDYLHETKIKHQIANIPNTKIEFETRTVQSYINTYTKVGFVLETVIETGVPDSFVIKYPQYRPFQHKPYRLNLKFLKP